MAKKKAKIVNEVEFEEARTFQIRAKIFKLDDFRKLAEFLSALSDASGRKKTEMEFTVRGVDKSLYTSGDPLLFSPSSILERKRIDSVEMEWGQFSPKNIPNRIVSIKIANTSLPTDGGYTNRVILSGENSTWVNGVLNGLEELIQSVEPQTTFWTRRKNLIDILVSMGIGFILFYILRVLLPFILYPWAIDFSGFISFQRTILGFALSFFSAWLLGFTFFGGVAIKNIESIWPDVEIQVGPAHTFAEKRFRIFIAQVVALGILPILINLLTQYF